ncbi:MAG TPA: VWA domain-containing protein [Bryobacteraceae bacterium]|nr:VWA domain-containing protein [Bryobacteraceae bacterium]
MLYRSFLIFASLAAFAQPPIRVDSTLVVVPVTVTDGANRYVLGLEKQNFQVFEDSVKQDIKQFSGEDAPLSVGFIVDTSASIGGKLDICRAAVAQFLKTMNAADEAFLVEFNDHAELTVAFTRDTSRIVDKLTRATSGGTTALFDALYAGLHEMKKASNPRKTLLLISDGGDNSSVFSAKQILNFAREADVQIYAMGVFEAFPVFRLSVAESAGPHLLSEITEQTGGRAFAAPNLDALPGIAARIGIELRNQYVLAYSPANKDKDGKYRRLDVKVAQPEGISGLKARWRQGYYAPAE